MNVQYLAGAHEVHNTVLPPYDDLVCEFLDTLAGSLRRDSEAKKYPDVQTFAFWCRKANIQKLKKYINRMNHIYDWEKVSSFILHHRMCRLMQDLYM